MLKQLLLGVLGATFSSPSEFQHQPLGWQRRRHRSGTEWSMADFISPGESLGTGTGAQWGHPERLLEGSLWDHIEVGGGHHGPSVSPFDHVLVDNSGDDGQCDDIPGSCQHFRELFILWERAGRSGGVKLSPPPQQALVAPLAPSQAPTFMPMTFWPFTSQM